MVVQMYSCHILLLFLVYSFLYLISLTARYLLAPQVLEKIYHCSLGEKCSMPCQFLRVKFYCVGNCLIYLVASQVFSRMVMHGRGQQQDLYMIVGQSYTLIDCIDLSCCFQDKRFYYFLLSLTLLD